MCGSYGFGITIPQGKEISAFSKMRSPASAPTQLSVLCVPSPFPEGKHETDYSLPTSIERGSFTSTPHVISCHGAKLSIE
jgi:hypothetical protein